MGRPAKAAAAKQCKACHAAMTRKRINGRLEDLGVFSRRIYCDQACMAKGMVKEQCVSISHSRLKASRLVKPQCERCGVVGRLHVHHKDEDPFNNTPSNLMTLCPRCHRQSHSPNFMADGETRKPCKHCARPSVKAGLCSSHLSRRQRFGNPLAVKIKTASGWVLDTSGLAVRSRRSQPENQQEPAGCAAMVTPSSRSKRRNS